MPFFVKANCQALKEFPHVNTIVRGDQIVYNHYCDIEVAVAVDEALIVPVVRDADKMFLLKLRLKLNELAEKPGQKKSPSMSFRAELSQ